jgi:hypothetical protein
MSRKRKVTKKNLQFLAKIDDQSVREDLTKSLVYDIIIKEFDFCD